MTKKGRLCSVAMLLMTIVVSLLMSCQQSGSSFDVDRSKSIASDLRNSKLYEAAIDEYKSILTYGDIDETSRGSISYLIARIYFEDLKDYRNAAAYYVRARSLDPEATYAAEASRNLVASLEKLGQIVDARRELGAAANVDPVARPDSDLPVAIIAEDTVWLSEVENQIQALPAQMQQQFLEPGAKVEYMRQYVATELLYRAAEREGYDRDAEMIRNRELLFKRLIVEKFVENKVMPEIRIDTSDVRNFYLANKTSRYGDKPYDSVMYQAYSDYQQEKATTAYSAYIERLVRAEKVRFLDHNIR